MRPRTLVALSLSIVSLSLLSSCDALFTTNLFKEAGLGQISAAALAEKDSSGLYEEAYTSDGSPSETFFETLSGDSTAKAQVLATLQTDYTNSSSPTAQQSAILYADIQLRTSGASSVVSGLAAAAASGNIPSSTSSTDEIKSFIASVIPSALLDDETAFKAAIASLLAEKATYSTLADNIASNGAQPGILTGSYASAAQAALVAAALSCVTYSGSSLAESLWVSLTTSTSQITGMLELDSSTGILNIASILSAGGYNPADFGL